MVFPPARRESALAIFSMPVAGTSRPTICRTPSSNTSSRCARIPAIVGRTSTSGTIPIRCVGFLSGWNTPIPLIIVCSPPGKASTDTLPSAPAVLRHYAKQQSLGLRLKLQFDGVFRSGSGAPQMLAPDVIEAQRCILPHARIRGDCLFTRQRDAPRHRKCCHIVTFPR